MRASVLIINRHGSETATSVFEFSSVADLEFQVAEFANLMGFRRYEAEVDSQDLTQEMAEELDENGFILF